MGAGQLPGHSRMLAAAVRLSGAAAARLPVIMG